jgi:hypothetical protein
VEQGQPVHRTEALQAVEDPHLSSCDLWEEDVIAHEAARQGFVMAPDAGGHGGYEVVGGFAADPLTCSHHNHRRAYSTNTIDTAAFSATAAKELETEMLRERLHGYVRPSHCKSRSEVPHM